MASQDIRNCVLAILLFVAGFEGRALAQAGTGSSPIDYEAIRRQKIVTAVRVTERITVDGVLEEPAWGLATPATGFIQWQPQPGEPSPEATEARFLYDGDSLYVAVICPDSDPSRMVITELKEDFSPLQSDSVSLLIDSLHDRRSGINFTVNPAGAKRDNQISNDIQSNADWDGVWDAKVSRNERGWIVEFVIPFKTLRFSTAAEQEWGVNISRRILRSNEESTWAPVPIRYRTVRVSSAGTLVGLENIVQGRNLKVKPFVTAGITQQGNGDGLVTVDDYDGGVDVKYGLDASLTLDATYRTDFAQVEVDQQQVNLTRFNVFFPEKRDFFLENSGTFSFGPGGNLVPFFSRSIGLSNSGSPIPIVGGARLSGTKGRYDIGFLAMKTDDTSAVPSNNYLVGRVKRNLLQNSWIGAIATHRDSTVSGDYNRVYGIDSHWLFYDKLEFDSYVLASNTPNRSGRNQARRFQTAWRGDELVAVAEYNAVQTNFSPEVGFIRRRDNTNYSGELTWNRQFRRSDTFRSVSFSGNLDYFQGPTGKIETRTIEFRTGVLFQDSATADFTINETFDRLSRPFPIRSNISIPTADYSYRTYTASFSTNLSRTLSGNGNTSWGEFWDGERRTVGGGVNVKLNEHFTATATYSRNNVTLPVGSFSTGLVGARFIYSFTPRAFLNAFLQYNQDTHQISSNVRFNLIHHPLSDLYVVYNERRDTQAGELVERAFILKISNLFNF